MLRICKICGNEFESKSSRRSICYDTHIRQCKICGKDFEVKTSPFTQQVCSNKYCKAQYVRSKSTEKSKICEWCGKEFKPTGPHQKFCPGPHYGTCKVCGQPVLITNMSNPVPCCSDECTQKLREATMTDRFGASNIMKTQEGKDRLKKHYQEMYGVDSIFQTEDFKKQALATNLERYHVSYPAQSDVIRDKMRQTWLNNLGVEEPLSSPEVRSKVTNTMQERYGVPWYCMTEDYHKYQSIISQINRDFGKRLETYGIPYKFERRLQNRSYDIEIINQNVLIEINPTITHNSYFSIFDKESTGLDSSYHKSKSELARSRDFRCIHIFDWDDWDKIIQLLKPKAIVYARNCTLRQISSKTAAEFETWHHLQGTCRNQSVCYGLYYRDDLIELMTFGSPRYNKKYDYELLRLCTHTDYIVIGGASKLFKHFIKDHPDKSVISYCDLAKFTGDVYLNIGMALKDITQPSIVWSKDSRYIRDSLLRQRGFDQLFKTNYGKNTSNHDLMIQNGWLPVYDCGQAVYEFK